MHALTESFPITTKTDSRLGSRSLVSLRREQDFRPLRVEGTLPADLHGTFYRNGPARFDIGTRPHWFDGTGAIIAVRLGTGAQGAVKLIHSPSADHDTGRSHQRYGAFRQPASVMQRIRALFGASPIRNAANINVLPWQGRLFALFETVLPIEIDPATLASIGETNLEGLIPRAWNAHPHRVASRQTIYQFGLRVGPQCWLDVFALPRSGAARLLTSVPIPGVMEAHDFFATDNHLVFVLPPLWCSPTEMLRGGSFVESLKWRPQAPTTVIVIPIDRPHDTLRLETDPFFFFHSVNAYESRDGKEIVLDLIRYPDFAGVKHVLDAMSDGESAPAAQSSLWRGRIDLTARRVQWEERWPQALEFPAVHRDVQGSLHQQSWAATYAGADMNSNWFNRLECIDVERGSIRTIDPGPRCNVSEPALVPRSTQEDDVYVLSLVQDRTAGASWLGIWDGQRTDSPPLAKVWFDQLLPAPLHGCWVRSKPVP
jgi:all-trans-8'-apo-beta-carotenal 15,15'-oxygenase